MSDIFKQTYQLIFTQAKYSLVSKLRDIQTEPYSDENFLQVYYLTKAYRLFGER